MHHQAPLDKRHAILTIVGASMALAGCSVNITKAIGPDEYRQESREGSVEYARRQAYQTAMAKCRSTGKGFEELHSYSVYDNVGGAWVIHFKCFDPAQREAEERTRREAQQREAERQRAIQAEQERLAEIERRRQAAEWERTRPQREAAERAARQQREAAERTARQKEQNRLNGICPIYYIMRQTCATAGNYESCMNIRMSNKYSSWDDFTCRSR